MKRKTRFYYSLLIILTVSAALTALIASLYTPHQVLALDEKGIADSLKKASLKQGDLASGFSWQADENETTYRSKGDLYFADIAVSIGWNVEKNAGKEGWEYRDVGSNCYYTSGQYPDEAFSKSADSFRTHFITTGDHQETAYTALPGGVISEETSLTEGLFHDREYTYTIYFWKSPNYWGLVSNRMIVYSSSASTQAQGKSFCRAECERLAQLVWSRLPGGGTAGGTETGKLPDSALPIATGTTTAVTIILTLMFLRSQGYSPAEAMQILRDWLRGKGALPTKIQSGLTPPPQNRDGDVNENGDVWSDYAGGWVDRKFHDYWKSAQKEVDNAAEINRDLASRQSSYVKEAYDSMLDAKKKAEGAQQHIRDMEAKWAKEDGLKDQLRQFQKQMEADSSWKSYISEVYKGFGEGLGGDLYSVAENIRYAGEAYARTVDKTYDALTDANTYEKAYDVLTDVNTYKEIGRKGVDVVRSTVETAADIALHPLDSARKVNDFVMDGVKGAVTFTGKAGGHMIMHPIDTAIALLGVDNWEKVLDYNVPITERIGRALYGTVDTALTISSFGGSKIGLKAAETAIDVGKVADATKDALKTADIAKDAVKVADTAGDAGKIAKLTEETKRVRTANFEAAREAAQGDCRNFVDKYNQYLDTEQKYRKQYNDAREAMQSTRLNDTQKAAARDIFEDAEKQLNKADRELKETAVKINSSEQAKFEAKREFSETTGNGLKVEHKQAFNEQIKKVYDDTDKAVIEELAKKKNIDPKSLIEDPQRPGLFRDKDGRPVFEVAKPTNPSKEVKIGMDQDITYRERAKMNSAIPDPDNPNSFGIKVGEAKHQHLYRKPGEVIIEHKDMIRVPDPKNPGSFIVKEVDPIMVDVKASEIKNIHAEKFYEAATGQKATDLAAAEKFAKEQGQVVTDRLHKEAYGRGMSDLKIATSEPGKAFSDPTQIGKAIGYKAHEFYQDAQKIRATNPLQAESLIAEGMRQTTKQFDKQLIPRLNAISEQFEKMGMTKPTIPPRLEKAVDIMKFTEKAGIAPATIESRILKETGLSIDDVSTQVGEFVEALQKLKPGWLR